MVKKSISNAHFAVFLSRRCLCRKRPRNLYKHKNSFLKTNFSLIIEYGMYLKCLHKTSMPWLVLNKPSAPIRRVENKVEFLERQFHSEKLSFVHKRKLSILLNFLFPFVSFIGVFSILKCKTLVLKTTTSWSRVSHFVDGWHLQRCQIRFFPHPLNGWQDHWTFVGEWGMGDLYCKNFFPNLSGVRNFFFQHCTSWAIFFSAQDIFLQGIYLHAFFFSKSVCRTFSLKSPITPSKVKWSAPKIQQTFGQLTGSDLSIISKGFWNNRGQISLGERGGIRSYLPLPGKFLRTYGDVVNKFSRMDSLPNFITHGAPLRALRSAIYIWRLIQTNELHDR